MNTIKVTTQAELDALPASFKEYTIIEIRGGTVYDRISVTTKRDNSSVVAWDNSSVEARGNSSVVALGNSSVVARDNSSVVARDNSSVEALGSSSVEAWDNSSVVALGSSSVVAWDNSSVEARDNVGVHSFSRSCTVELFAFAACWMVPRAKSCKRHGKNATVIFPKRSAGTKGWLSDEGIAADKGRVIVFKRVSAGFKTQENTPRETLWVVGSEVEHKAWSPKEAECGEGKFHACSRPYFCDEFRSNPGDKYVAISVAVKDLYAFPEAQYPHKVAFRAGRVLYVCDKFGREAKP